MGSDILAYEGITLGAVMELLLFFAAFRHPAIRGPAHIWISTSFAIHLLLDHHFYAFALFKPAFLSEPGKYLVLDSFVGGQLIEVTFDAVESAGSKPFFLLWHNLLFMRLTARSSPAGRVCNRAFYPRLLAQAPQLRIRRSSARSGAATCCAAIYF